MDVRLCGGGVGVRKVSVLDGAVDPVGSAGGFCFEALTSRC